MQHYRMEKGVGIVSELCAVFSHQTPVVAGDSELWIKIEHIWVWYLRLGPNVVPNSETSLLEYKNSSGMEVSYIYDTDECLCKKWLKSISPVEGFVPSAPKSDP